MPVSPLVAVALDLAASWMERPDICAPRYLVLASAAVYGQEMRWRVPGTLTIDTEESAVHIASHLDDHSHSGMGAELNVPDHGTRPEEATACSAVLWALPQRATWRARLPLLTSLQPGSRLAIATPGPLAAVFGLNRPRWLIGQRLSILLPELRKLGYVMKAHHSIGRPQSILWATSSRVTQRVGRLDLMQRCEAGFRLTLTPPLENGASILRCTLFERGLGSD